MPDYIERAARAYDPEAFEDHPIEQRRPLAAIQWGARRRLATEAAQRLAAAGLLTPSGTFASTKPSDANTAERIARAWDEGYTAGSQDGSIIGVGRTANPHATLPVAATEVVSGYTSHGHRITGVVQTGRPTSVARCGGPGLCTVCSLEAGMATNERHER